MKYTLLFLFAFLIVACSNESKNQLDSTPLKLASLEKVPQKYRELFQPSIDLINSEIKAYSNSKDHSNYDAKFKAFLVNYNLEINKINDKIYENEEFQKLALNTPGEKINKALSRTGIMVTLAEGSAYLEPNISFLLKSFKPYLSGEMQNFLSLRIIDTENPAAKDAAIVIPFNELSERIVSWEKFITGNHEFVSLDEAKEIYNNYIYYYLVGLDNTPIYSYENKTLKEEVKQSYTDLIKKYPETKSAAIVKDYLKLLERSNFKEGSATEKFLEENNYGRME